MPDPATNTPIIEGTKKVTGVAVAETAVTQACTIRADVPNSANDAVVGRSGCSNTVSGTGRIKEYRNNFPDDVVGSRTFNAGLAWVYGSCGNGTGSYYSEFSSSSGAYGKSATVTTCR